MKFAAVLLSLILCAPAFAEECSPDVVQLRGEWGQARFAVELADDEAERAQGLMHRESMPQSAGMLFVYPEPRMVGFWMKNTLIPLDMIFVDSTGTVQRVHSNAVPGDLTPIMGGSDTILAVLEINGGLSRKLGIAPGTQLRHPAFAPDRAAWSC
ncbi:DUF192 domain-containing protein [Roseovarius nanhaiticus]|uniref:DUF192 domain-containing protein n=1 Tax=Roseovarius nanhaiticus TaxID=573024 RepID=A0A1N7G8R4_9RHOB|nr:DUF192 domain-containing protein [Roseovarius nanhaiticus]SEK33996.1 hypothetical protein SAMN05216208_0351 [Roseovarius nanhaiticus]SIS08982.1 hypothetical protein SAMN05421666_1785 [Roseovarius nanhaiticus]